MPSDHLQRSAVLVHHGHEHGKCQGAETSQSHTFLNLLALGPPVRREVGCVLAVEVEQAVLATDKTESTTRH